MCVEQNFMIWGIFTFCLSNTSIYFCQEKSKLQIKAIKTCLKQNKTTTKNQSEINYIATFLRQKSFAKPKPDSGYVCDLPKGKNSAALLRHPTLFCVAEMLRHRKRASILCFPAPSKHVINCPHTSYHNNFMLSTDKTASRRGHAGLKRAASPYRMLRYSHLEGLSAQRLPDGKKSSCNIQGSHPRFQWGQASLGHAAKPTLIEAACWPSKDSEISLPTSLSFH